MADWDEIYAEIAAGSVDLLLVSPERLNNPGFRDLVLPKLAATAGMLVVDEAHCISDWGHDFRPDYRRLRTVLENLPPGVPVLATTATANARVTRDVAEQLASGADGEALVLRGPLDRDSLCLGVVQLPAAQQRLGWLAEHLDELPGSGIIYTLTVAAAHETAAFLRDRGHNVLPYTGRDEQEQRLAAERALLDGELKALVATSALGMGFDKPDLGFVVHLGAPQSPVAYYQQIGRAGRAVPRAEVVLLPGPEDRDIWAYFASLAFPPEPLVRTTLGALDAAAGPLSSGALETQVNLSRARLEMMLKVLDVDGAVRKVSGGWVATGQPWEYDAERYATVAAERHREQQAMLSYLRTPGCRMEYLRQQLDDPEAQPCGRCDNCTGRPWPAEVSAEGAELARARLLRPGIDISPRRMWPPGMKRLGVDVAGKIPAELSADTGRALGRAHRPRVGPPAPRSAGTGSRRRSARRLWARRPGARRLWVRRLRAAGPRRCAGPGAGRLGLGAAPGRRGHPAQPHPAPAHRQPGRADRGDRPAAHAGLPELCRLRAPGGGLRRPAVQQPAAAPGGLARAAPAWTAGRGGRLARRPGAGHRRPHRQRVDDDGRGPAAPRGRRAPGIAPRPRGQCRLTVSCQRPPGRFLSRAVGFSSLTLWPAE